MVVARCEHNTLSLFTERTSLPKWSSKSRCIVLQVDDPQTFYVRDDMRNPLATHHDGPFAAPLHNLPATHMFIVHPLFDF